MKGTSSSRASYSFYSYADGTVYVKTLVCWSRSFGKCKRQDFHKSGEIYTQTRFKSWCKKYKLTPSIEEINKLPKTN